MSLPSKNRLKNKKDFNRIFKSGNTKKGRFLLIKYMKTDVNPKIGFIVSSKVAKKAVDRNKTRRILANEVQKNINKINKDAVVLVLGLPLKKELKNLLVKDINKLILNLYEKNND